MRRRRRQRWPRARPALFVPMRGARRRHRPARTPRVRRSVWRGPRVRTCGGVRAMEPAESTARPLASCARQEAAGARRCGRSRQLSASAVLFPVSLRVLTMSDPNALIPPPLTPAGDVDAALASTGFAVVGPQGVEALLGAPLAALDAWLPYWDRLPPDAY